MLSRMLKMNSSRLLVRSKAVKNFPILKRNLMSSSLLKNSIPASTTANNVTNNETAVSADSLDPPSLINKYGATTFWGMFAAILVSKELFILDAEFLLSAEIVAVGFAGYIMLGNSYTKYVVDSNKESMNKFHGSCDFMIEMFEQYRLKNSTLKHKPEVLKQYSEEYKKSIEAFAEYNTIKPRHVAREKMLARLDQIRVKEQHEKAMEWQATVEKAVSEVKKAFGKGGDPKLHDQMMDLAIKNLGFKTPVTNDANDPVKRMFMAQFPEK